MQYDLTVMSAQEVAEAVAKHLFSQGRQSIIPSRDPEDSFCVYRGPDGLKCAADIFISNELYKPEMEDNVWYVVVSAFEGIPSNHQDLIRQFQGIHDSKSNWISTDMMRNALKMKFQRHNLDPSILDALSFSDR